MPIGRYRLRKETNKLHSLKQDEVSYISGRLGIPGSQIVKVPNRPNFVYVRLRGDLSELIKAFNNTVPNVYDLPVLVVRDENNKNKYSVFGRDTGMYENWGGSPSLSSHGWTHSFDPFNPGNDIAWIYDNQIMQFAPIPSGTNGAMNLIVDYGMFYSNHYSRWIYAGGTGTPSFSPYKPTDGNANVNLLYINYDGNPKIAAGSSFSSSLTGTSDVFQYLPLMPDDIEIPICAVRLVSGTSTLIWDNIYNLRQLPSGYNLSPPSGQAIFTVDGDVSVASGAIRIYNHLGRRVKIIGVYLSCNTAPVGSDLIVDVNKDGVTLFTSQPNRPRIVDGNNTGNSVTIENNSWLNGSYLTMDVDQVGSGTPGSNLTVTVVYR